MNIHYLADKLETSLLNNQKNETLSILQLCFSQLTGFNKTLFQAN